MNISEQIQLCVTAYFLLQITMLFLLPKWWKAAACPSLVVVPIILLDMTDGGNLSGFITLWVTPYAIGWLVLILILFVVAKAGKIDDQSDTPADNDASPEN